MQGAGQIAKAAAAMATQARRFLWSLNRVTSVASHGRRQAAPCRTYSSSAPSPAHIVSMTVASSPSPVASSAVGVGSSGKSSTTILNAPASLRKGRGRQPIPSCRLLQSAALVGSITPHSAPKRQQRRAVCRIPLSAQHLGLQPPATVGGALMTTTTTIAKRYSPLWPRVVALVSSRHR